MKFPAFTHPITGVAIPISALKTKESCGTGEFLDLIPFADFCVASSIQLIQLLPVNDTGTESSPYSALSAFALHPVYIRFQSLPEAKDFSKEIKALQTKYESLARIDYRGIRNAKLALLHKIFDANVQAILAEKNLYAWIQKNPWIIQYAVFMNLKKRNFDASWKAWDKHRTPSSSEILSRWENESKKKEHLFFAWLQMRLEEQFLSAVSYCNQKGLALKGDIPIMMNEDSCDAWAHPEFFRDDLRAGSPPDDSNPLGQNWGFPIYNWTNLKADNFSWWTRRLEQSAKFYHAYRIDHILGFFRIWNIPYGEYSGYLGWTNPHKPISLNELIQIGFSDERLRWLCEPHVPTWAIEQVNNNDYLGSHGILHTLMNRIGNEELWLFKPEIKHESDIWNSSIPQSVKEELARRWKDRLLLETGRDSKGKPYFSPIWEYKKTTAWNSLTQEEKQNLEKLILENRSQDEILWKNQAIELLGTLVKSTDMLACAEDLGTIPQSVPEVLNKFNILGLKVIRWERKWTEPGSPFKNFQEYPQLSVATSSVHDSSTIREWWEKENGGADFIQNFSGLFPKEILEDDSSKTTFTPRIAQHLLSVLAKTSSKLFVLPIQDFLYLSQEFYSKETVNERINVPGTVSDFNWTYRLPVLCEALVEHKKLTNSIKTVLNERNTRTK